MFCEWLVEAYYLRMFLELSQRIPHHTTPKVFFQNKWYITREDNLLFHIITYRHKKIFTGIDSTGFKITHAS